MESKTIQFDRFFFNSLFGMVFPILCFFIFWWSPLLFTNEERIIMIAALSGLGLGTLISIAIRLIWKPDIYKLSSPILLVVYSFYNIGLFGFFMGVPVFHPVLGILAGYYCIKRLIYQNDTIHYKSEINRISRFTAIVTGFICLFSAIIALSSKSTPDDLKGMLQLPFDISQPMLVAFIITGGLFLITAQYWLTKITMITTLKFKNTEIPEQK